MLPAEWNWPRKHKLPLEVADFISTHHGTRKVEYFYIKQKLENPEKSVDENTFTYPGTYPLFQRNCAGHDG